MNKRAGSVVINSKKKAPLYPQNGGKSKCGDKSIANTRWSAKERKLALLEDVESLKKKLRHEENVHRALERAFNRPLGALPRLPAYLPQYTLELLAEVAVLEEEVVRLEEQVVNFRQGLYKEAVYISSTRTADSSTLSSKDSPVKISKPGHSRSLSQNEANLGSKASPILSRSVSSRKFLPLSSGATSEKLTSGIQSQNKRSLPNGPGKENESSPNLDKDKHCPEKKSMDTGKPLKNPRKTQCRIVEAAQESSSGSSDDRDRVVDNDSETNKISEDIMKCLISIFVRLGSSKGRTMDLESFSSLGAKSLSENGVESDFRDPYCISSERKKRDIGAYKHLYTIGAQSLDFNRKKNASFLIRRLKILLDKLASVKLDGLSHQQKLAFWINVYNSCIMNAFLENGIPENPDMTVLQMQKATIKVGGHLLNALMIEHLILRLPHHLKYVNTCTKSGKSEESKICQTFGLEWSESLVTFALSCGSWSSPAVRVYTASQIEKELETAKKDYLQAAVNISATNKIMVPKLLDWYLLDFAKDLDALLDWLCLQLPDELRNRLVKCLERKESEPLSRLVQVMPYSFDFRYLICR